MSIMVTKLHIPDVLVIEPAVFPDQRGFFFESFNQAQFDALVNKPVTFVQDNHSQSKKGVLRGLHYQVHTPQGKLVRVIQGEVFDVAVDLRRSSNTFGAWVGVRLSADNKKQLWVPEGFAHGFLVLSATCEFLYKTTDYYSPQNERCIIYNDAKINIDWPLDGGVPIISEKDRQGVDLEQAEVFD